MTTKRLSFKDREKFIPNLREKDKKEILKLFKNYDVVILSGFGGMGKTRLMHDLILTTFQGAVIQFQTLTKTTQRDFRAACAEAIYRKDDPKNPIGPGTVRKEMKSHGKTEGLITIDEFVRFVRGKDLGTEDRKKILRSIFKEKEFFKVITTARPRQAEALLDSLRSYREVKAVIYPVGPLTPKQVQTLLVEWGLTGESIDNQKDWMYRLTGGNPRLLHRYGHYPAGETIRERVAKGKKFWTHLVHEQVIRNLTKPQLATLQHIKDGIPRGMRTNSELTYLDRYGIIDLKNKKNPIRSELLREYLRVLED